MLKAAALSLVAIGLLAVPASALTITNKSTNTHKFGIDLGNTERVETLAAGKSVTVKDCNDGCGFTGPWGYSWMAKTGENFSFDDSKLMPDKPS